MKIIPLYDRVVVKRINNNTKTASGIFLPDSATEKPDQGEIISIGKGKILNNGKLQSLSVKIGDHILFGKYSGQVIKINNQELLVMREEDIFAIIEK